jgi:hypothetical protein
LAAGKKRGFCRRAIPLQPFSRKSSPSVRFGGRQKAWFLPACHSSAAIFAEVIALSHFGGLHTVAGSPCHPLSLAGTID